VLSVLSFTTEEEAIALANATTYGLAATVWTRDMGLGRRLAGALRVGRLWVRTSRADDSGVDHLLGYEPQRSSGFGSEIGVRGLESYSTLKAVSFTGR
jgi:acyl-CoA reductase-like NAD-dependent aldehyde dehydrogenase